MKAALPLWEGVQARFEDTFGADRAAEPRTFLDGILDSGFAPWAE